MLRIVTLNLSYFSGMSFAPFSQIRRSRFLRHNAIFFMGSLAMGFLNYLYYPVMSRMLPPSSFGEVQTLFSLFAQINIFLSVLGLLTVNIVANYDNAARRDRMIFELERLAVLISGVFLVATILGAGVLQRFFHFDSAVPFVALILAVMATVPLTFRSAFLRGKHFFGLVSTAGILAAAGDLLLSIAFVGAGWSTTGAIIGLVLAQFAAFLFAAWAAGKHGFSERFRRLFKVPDIRFVLPELRYALLVLTGSLTITALYSLDIIAIKHFFDARTAGLYAGISTIARIIFFLTASIVQVLMPSIKLKQTMLENRQTLLKSFLLLVGIGGATLLVFTLVPRLLIRLLIGSNYLTYAGLLPRLSLALFVISILNLFIMYHVALRRYGVIPIVLAGIVLTVGLLSSNHDSLQAIINNLLYGSSAMLAGLGLWLSGRKHKATGLKEGY
jgi:O-antigen/teichoic acid export membrane protein